MTERIAFSARVLRKADDLPRYIVVEAEHVAGRTAAFKADVTLDDGDVFVRNIRPWGKSSDIFFFNLTARQCAKAGLDTHDKFRVTITPLG